MSVALNLYFSSYIMTSRTDKKSKKQGSPAFLMLHRFSGRGIATESEIFYYTQQGKTWTVALEASVSASCTSRDFTMRAREELFYS